MNPFKSIINMFKSLKAVLSTLFKKPMTLKFPEESLKPVGDYRGRHHLDPEECASCDLCAEVCPNRAIELVESHGKKLPQVHLGRCSFCGLCAEKCPTKALTMTSEATISLTDKSSAVYGPDKLSQPVEKG